MMNSDDGAMGHNHSCKAYIYMHTSILNSQKQKKEHSYTFYAYAYATFTLLLLSICNAKWVHRANVVSPEIPN